MKFTVETKEFVRALQAANLAVAKRNNIPILYNLLLVADEDSLRVTGTDLGSTVQRSVDAVVEEAGGLLVNARDLLDTAKAFQSNHIWVSVSDNELVLTDGNTTATTTNMLTDTSDFPIPPNRMNPYTTLSTHELFEAVDHVFSCVSTKDLYPILAGINFKFDGYSAVLAGSDGFRLGIDTITVSNTSLLPEVTLPAPYLKRLKRILNGSSIATVGFDPNRRSIQFSNDDTMVDILVLEGKYPDYNYVIPHDLHTMIFFNRNEMVRSLQSLADFVDKKEYPAVYLSVDEASTLKLRVKNKDKGEIEQTLPAVLVGEVSETAVNPRFLLGVLCAMDDDSVSMQWSAKAPILIHPESEIYPTFVVMPIVPDR